MNLSARLAEPGDLVACAKLFENHRAYPATLVQVLPEIWRRLMREEALRICVFEDHDRPPGARIVACSASVFITDKCVSDTRQGAKPFLAERLLRQDLHGASPILRPAAISERNSGDGLNVVILNYAEAPTGYNATQRFVLTHKTLEAFIWLHRGYNLKQMLQELCDEVAPPFIPDSLAPVLTDYADYYRRKGATLPPCGERFYLTGISRDEAMAAPGSAMAPIFAYTPPRFFFSGCERRLLERALLGGTDTQLAHALRRALPTVKSLWRTIYNRVGRVDPDLLSCSVAAELGRQATRGLEHRRRILQYLRHHPEELRPYASPASASARRRAV